MRMEAGPELDALIAEKVMRFKGQEDQKVWLYSTDIHAAAYVLARMDDTHEVNMKRRKQYDIEKDQTITGWYVLFMPWDGGSGVQATAQTLPHAICLAALNAMES